MFDIGFSELILIALVALIVIGPERLPKVARTAGHLLGRLQRYVNDVKADINREMQLDELKRLQQQVEQSAREMELSVNKELTTVEETLNQPFKALSQDGGAQTPSPAEHSGAPAEAAAAAQADAELGQEAGAVRKAG
jgi:sec-independent protein translocase protein TatB